MSVNCTIGQSHDGIVVAFKLPFHENKNLEIMLAYWESITYTEGKSTTEVPGIISANNWKALEHIKTNIYTELNRLCRVYPNNKIYFTGHGKCGSIALIAAADFLRNHAFDAFKTEVITFGAPLSGDAEFVEYIEAKAKIIRYENALDLVPFLPATEQLMKKTNRIPQIGHLFAYSNCEFVPAGVLRYIKDKGDVIESNIILNDIRIAELVGQLLNGADGLQRIVTAHSIMPDSGYKDGVCKAARYEYEQIYA